MINALGEINQVWDSELVAKIKLRDGVDLSDEVRPGLWKVALNRDPWEEDGRWLVLQIFWDRMFQIEKNPTMVWGEDLSG